MAPKCKATTSTLFSSRTEPPPFAERRLEEAKFHLGDVTASREDQGGVYGPVKTDHQPPKNVAPDRLLRLLFLEQWNVIIESEPSGSSAMFSFWERRLHRTKCATPYLFSCFNGGECVHQTFCDCRRFNATGPRCQTVYNTGPERDNICRTWGQHHVETFDGLYYYFSGRASYTLVGQYEPGEQSFSIQVHNYPECSSFPYSCPRSVSLFFAGEDEIRLSRNVTHGGLGVQLPHITGNLRLHQMAGYVIVQHQSAFTLAWDGESAVYIKMNPEYLGKTHGLCGNNNADPQDDLKTSFGKLTEDVAEFVNSWQEDPPDETPGPNVSFPSRPPCFHQSTTAMQGVYELCEALQKPPFDTCHDYVSPLPYMASCTSDLCLSASEDTTWCRALTEYARACAHAGRSLQGWRVKFPLCAVTCKEEAFIYNECINCCPVSCQPRTPCIDSEIACVDGCYCPEGLIFEDGGCMAPAECPCEFHGSLYPTGSVVNDDCNTCTCRGGKWMCSASACPVECSVTGDIHFTTFDGRRYTFPATCQYILAKSRSSGTFTVTIQNAPCGPNQDGACIQSVTVILNQTPRRQVTLTQAGDVLMSGQYKVTLPYTDDAFEIRKLSSVFLRVRTSVGVQVLYDREGLRLYIQVDQRWKDDTVGLCGTFNGNMQDDFLSPVGVPESTPQLFGNSWKTLSTCSPGISSSPLDPCDVHLQAASYAAEACSVLTKDLFAPCSPYLSPIPYYEQCRRDACRCGHICMCSALAHYTHLCHRHGVTIDFRTQLPDCALSCEATKEYSPCVASCGQTCQALAMPESCSDEEDHCVEGCACPPDTYLDNKAERCVPRSQCPCYFQGVDYPPGENNIPSLGHCHCIDGVMSCYSRAPVSACPLGQVFVNCTDPHVDLALSRERTCEHQLLNLTVPAHGPCVSGCTCPQGLVKHGDECFVPDECPCSWKGKEYFPGDMVNSSCHTCVCQHGSFQCTFHPCPATCTAYGDRHYRTFDGLPFDFLGTCKVHLVKSTSNFSFSVIMENVNCYNTGIICRKFISINVGNSLLIFDDETGTPSPVSFLDENQEIHMWRVGFFTVVHFPHEHITLLWDQRTTVHVQMGPQWQGMLAGLCGNFDLKTVNEMRTPENLELTNPQEFGSSWAAVECPDSSDPRDPCSLNPLREPFAKKECSILLSEVFETCHPVVDVTWFYSNCLTDTCGCSRGGDCECLCTSLSAYAHQCCQHGITIDWRSPRLCPYDCDYFNKALGKGPYQLVSHEAGGTRVTVRKASGAVILALRENVGPEDTINFLLTSSVYKPKAHDSDLVSFESADRPNYFLHVTTNGSLSLAKWERTEGFQNRATFIIHRSTWLPGYDALESFNEPGSFISLSGPVPILQRYQHTEQFRLATLLKLVGVCDGDVANDLTLPDGTVVQETEDPTPFLDSWQLPSTLTSVGQFRYREDSCATADCSPCLRMVSNRTFSSCHDFVTPESFCELWIRDTKYVQQPCVALTVYVAMCHKFNVCIEWRRSDYCPFLCPGDSTYQACVAVCDTPRTCQDGGREPPDPELCSVLGEGCVCPEGTVLHRLHSALCIPEEKCACTDSLGVPRAVGEIWNSSLSGCCQDQCVAPNTIIPVDLGCPETEPGGCQRFGEVALQLPTEDPCCLSTVCVCNQTLCEGLTPTCPPGDRLLMHYQEESCCPSYTCECDPEQCEAQPDPQCRQDQMVLAGRLGNTCCISYFCACDACPDPIPTCQQGEVLTVDSDTAEFCCPVYRCECQSFRCPQLQCGLGTSLVEVWSPDRCCPYKSCECDCDTIPVPKCHLWELRQLDMEFTQSAENVCDCVKYNCVKAPVCLSQERGVLQPGQKVVELSADGVCRTSHCTDVLDPLTNFYQINTTSLLCDVQCEENQEYQPPQDLATCCGSCKNVSCLFTFPNGTEVIFLPGASWISDCARHDCSNTALGVVLVVSPIICPPLNETECGKVGGSVVPSLEGCCKTCKEDGRSCKKVTVRMTIRKSDCRSNTPVNIVSCDGKCPSASIYNYNINTYARFCKCCREMGLQRRSVQLFCTGNASWVPYTIQEPTDCACQWF
ncbi:otogelin [Trichosurus vulpecula]|uniref:otogelin n=1 Tax=Trichosurus vulpecula TaxID=9337 RepID=UPI00186B068E|nr:otogelin [Trichosurus vulpecula]